MSTLRITPDQSHSESLKPAPRINSKTSTISSSASSSAGSSPKRPKTPSPSISKKLHNKGYSPASSTPKTPTTPKPRWVLIVNGLKRKEWESQPHSSKLVRQIRNAKCEMLFTESVGHATVLAEEATKAEVEMIIVAGGDGTLNEVIDGVMHAAAHGGTKPIINVLPLGRRNNFFKSMYWDSWDFEKAMWRIGKGSVGLLDVARVKCASPNGVVCRHYINVASCGAPAVAASKINTQGWFRRKISTMTSFFQYGGSTLAVSVDGGEFNTLSGASMVAIGNGNCFANGLRVAPAADPYNGELQVVTGQKIGLFHYLKKKHDLKVGKHLQTDPKHFQAYNCQEVEVIPTSLLRKDPNASRRLREAPAPSQSQGQMQHSASLAKTKSSKSFVGGWGKVPLEVDGENIGFAPFSIEILPQAIKFMV